MCLMCEWYISSCSEPECVEMAKTRIEDAKATGDRHAISNAVDEYWDGRSVKLFIWKGYSEPCEHIKAEHGVSCEIFIREIKECNCDPHYEHFESIEYNCDGEHHYY